MKTWTIVVVLVVLALCMPAHLAAQLPGNELVSYSGVPCSYGPYTNTASNGDGSSLGCWGAGACRAAPYGNVNYQYPDVAFYQWWTCQVGVVTANGGSRLMTFYDPRYYNDQPYPWGLQAWANALVSDPLLGTSYYAGADEQDCDGGMYFSGPYDYVC